MKILVIDNYDSFVHNLARYLRLLGAKTDVVRHDQITLDGVAEKNPTHIVISPGPKGPEQAGISIELIKAYYQKCPILGVCLGHQAIVAAFGGQVGPAQQPMHGKASSISHNGRDLFREIKQPLTVGRYHSLAAVKGSLPDCLEITAITPDGEIMAISHKEYPTHGLQFHPESILTEQGSLLLQNFLR